jgi:hypothetical protein
MKKLLPLLKNLLVKDMRSFTMALMLMLLLGIGNRSHAQVYYMTNDATSGSSSAVDGINRMDYNGANATLLANSFTVSPGLMEIDLPNNRAFVYEAFSSSPPNGLSIKVVNLTSGAVTATIPITESTARCYAIKYDPINDYIYYIVADSAPTSSSANDALIKVKPDGTGKTVVISGFSKNPTLLALDVANNKAYVYNQLAAEKNFLTINLSAGTVAQTITITAPAGNPFLVQDIDYDAETDYIYYLSSNNSGATNANDAISKIHPNGTGYAAVVGVAQSPTFMALDLGNNRAFVFDNVSPARTISSIDLSTGTATIIKSLSSLPGSSTVTSLWVPNIPILSTATAASVSSGTATVGGNITRSDVSVTERGVVYSSTNTVPTIGGSGVTKASNGSGTGSFSGGISGLAGSTTYYLRSYATSGAGTAYGAVTTFTTLSNDATLSGFSISAGSLTPGFSSGIITYTASVANANSTITVTPIKNNANASIKVNNVTVASGSASGAINLNIGDNVITTVVTAQDGTTTKTYTLTVNRPKASQTITFNTLPTKTFGDGDFAPGASASSGLTVSYSSDNLSVATIVSGQIHIVGAGTANITASQGGDANNLAATNATQTLTVNKASQTITFNTLPAKTYGDGDFAPGATASSGLTVSYSSDNTAVATIVSNQIHIVGQGTANITASQAGDANRLAASSVAQSLTVNKATVTITAVAKTKVYGDSDPTFTFTPTGVIGGDAFTGALSRTAGANFGTYPINIGSLSYGNNYNISFNAANLTINKRSITVLPDAATKVYGDSDPSLSGFQLISGTLAPGDQAGGTYGRAAGESVGSYQMTLGTKNFSNGATDNTANYNVTIQPAYLTITAKPVTVTASVQTKTYGDPDPSLTYSYSSLAFSDTFTGSLTRDPGEGFGTYAITQGTLALSSNYTLSFTGNNLTISKKTINVTAIAASKTYGDTDPAFGYSNDALAFSDSFTGALSRDPGENVGTYAITLGSLAVNNNYIFNYTGANLSIGKATLTYVATPASRPFQTANPTFTGSVTGFVSGDSQVSATAGTLSFTSTATVNSAIGSYTILGSGLSATNYDFVQASANSTALTITQSNDATLAGLTVDQGTLNPVFSSSQTSYGLSVANNVASFNLTATVNQQNASITINGQSYTSGDSKNITLNAGPNNISIVTLAQDAVATKTYQLNVFRAYSTNAFASFRLNPTSTFMASTGSASENYSTSVSADISSVTVTPTSQDAGASIVINGQDVASGTASSPIPLGVGSTRINVEVRAQDGVSVRTYSLTVNRAGSSNAYASLAINPYSTFTHTTGTGSENYVTSVNPSTSSIMLTPTAQDANATILVNGAIVASGTASPAIPLSMGATLVNVEVRAQDGITVRTYTVTVNRSGSSNAQVSLKLNPSATFVRTTGSATENFSTSVAATTSTVNLIPTAQDEGAEIKVNGSVVASGTASDPIVVTGASTLINVTVKAADGTTTRSYSLTVTKTGSSNALATLALSPSSTLVRVTGSATENYSTSVSVDQASISITPTAQDAGASIKVNGTTVASGTSSSAVPLTDVATTITVTVTAQDGVTVRTYGITVNRIGSSNAQVALNLTPAATFTRVSGSATENFSTSVNPSTSSVTLTPTALAAGAVISVNGALVASGTASDPIALTDVSTLINVSVTAQDGVTTRSYSITVNKTGSSNAYAALKLTPTSVFVRTTGSATENFTTEAAAGVNSVTLTPTTQDAGAIVTVNGTEVTSGSASDAIALNGPVTQINVVVTAQNGVTVRTYNVEVTKPAVEMLASTKDGLPGRITNSRFEAAASNDGVVVHQGLSPNGDGSNDFLYIEGISAYAGNKLSIMNTGGALVFETKDYGKDGNHTFDGHSNKTGALLKPGTYFYALEYQVEKQNKRKTGYIIIKY